MRAVELFAILLVAGCNQVFGLEPTISSDSGAGDFDGDGVTDDVDNCPTVKNPQQENADGDAFGDACDTCPMFASASSHDEDGDHFGDDCDHCPGIPDFQDDSDGDGVGDLCDPAANASAPNTRKLFEGFVTESADWQPGPGAWMWSEDAVKPVGDLAMTDTGLRNTRVTTAATWTMAAGFESATRWSDGDQFGVVFSAGGHVTRCLISCQAGICVEEIVLDTLMLSTTSNVVPRPFTRVGVVASGGNVSCRFEAGVPIAGMNTTDKATLSVIASPRVHATYVDYIE